MEKGFNYFDTSFAYHNGTSEVAMKKAIVDRYPRESYQICDKMPTWALTSEEDNDKFVNTMLERLGIDYFDVFFVHNINVPWLKLAEEHLPVRTASTGRPFRTRTAATTHGTSASIQAATTRATAAASAVILFALSKGSPNSERSERIQFFNEDVTLHLRHHEPCDVDRIRD